MSYFSAAALRIANDPDCFLSTIQIGITLIGILTGLYSGASFAKAFGAILIGWGVAPAYALPVAQVLIDRLRLTDVIYEQISMPSPTSKKDR